MKALRDLIGTKVEKAPTENELLQEKIDQKWAEMNPGLYRTEQGQLFVFDKYKNLVNRGVIRTNIQTHDGCYVVSNDSICKYIPAEDLLGSILVELSELRDLWRQCTDSEDKDKKYNLESAALLYVHEKFPNLNDALIGGRLIWQAIGDHICLFDVELGLKQKLPLRIINMQGYKPNAQLVVDLYFRGILTEDEFYVKEFDKQEYHEKYSKYFLDDRIDEIAAKQNEFKEYISNVFTYRSKLNHIFGERGLVKFGPIDKIETFYLFNEAMKRYDDICPMGFKKQHICDDMNLYLLGMLAAA